MRHAGASIAGRDRGGECLDRSFELRELLLVGPHLLGDDQGTAEDGEHDQRHARRGKVRDLVVDERLVAELQIADDADDRRGREARDAEPESPVADPHVMTSQAERSR